MDLKDPKIQKIIIVGIMVVIVGYLYFFTSFMPFFYQPKKAEIESLATEYEKMSAELEKARRTVGKLEKLEKQYQKLHKKWVAAQSMLPEEKEVDRLLRKVTRAGNQAGVDFTLFQPKGTVRKQYIMENPVSVKIRGEYHQLGAFLSKVANLDRIVNVSGLNIKTIEESRGRDRNKVGRSYTIEAEMTLKAFTLLEGGEVADETEKASS